MNRRLPAEWEPQSGIQFTFPHYDSDWQNTINDVIPCFVRCIESVARFQKVVIICENETEVAPFLQRANQGNLRFLEIPSNDTWTRDYGALTILEDDRSILLDFVFNGWGGKFPAAKDNGITRKFFASSICRGDAIQNLDFVLEGGSIESDGQGTILTTSSCLLNPNRNPRISKKRVEEKLLKAFGLERILWLENGQLEGDDTDGHIDTLVRFCNAETIAYVQCCDPCDSQYGSLKKMEGELYKLKTSKGRPYHLVPLPLPSAQFNENGQRLPATYANFLIINGAVLMPTYNCPEDVVALRRLKKVFPNRELIGIDCRPLIEQGGSLHCITMQYPLGVIV